MGLADTDEPVPFWLPFFLSLLCGLPFVIITFFVAFRFGLLAGVINMLMGAACGLGARFAVRGWHPIGAALTATGVLLVFNISVVTLLTLIAERGGDPIQGFVWIVRNVGFTEFCNACVVTGGTTVMRYPLALLAAYRLSDGS